jgi:DNA-binding transcriptional MerR regulator
MPATDESPTPEHLSIGEVLSLLREEFPDITISKIRFLESQGLIVPERTPSGYRKFFDSDIETLRWVLRQQRDHFLPLKVIKAKLDGRRGTASAPDFTGTDDQPSLFGEASAPPATAPERAADTEGPSRHPAAPPNDAPSETGSGGTSEGAATPAAADAHEEASADVISAALGSSNPKHGAHSDSGSGSAGRDPAAWLAALQESPDPNAPPVLPATPRPSQRVAEMATHLSDVTYTAEQLAIEAGVEPEVVAHLAEFGLLVGSKFAGESVYDDAGLAVVRAASAILGQGIEARHLRGYKLGAEREVALFEQMILPLLRQRNPEAREQAQSTLDQMCAMGQDLREALITQALRVHLRRG